MITVFIFNFPRVSLYGQPRAQSWTRLASNATAGSTQIHICGNGSDWLVGDQIAIASSSYEPTEAEIRTISSFDPATQVIGFKCKQEPQHVAIRLTHATIPT